MAWLKLLCSPALQIGASVSMSSHRPPGSQHGSHSIGQSILPLSADRAGLLIWNEGQDVTPLSSKEHPFSSPSPFSPPLQQDQTPQTNQASRLEGGVCPFSAGSARIYLCLS